MLRRVLTVVLLLAVVLGARGCYGCWDYYDSEGSGYIRVENNYTETQDVYINGDYRGSVASGTWDEWTVDPGTYTVECWDSVSGWVQFGPEYVSAAEVWICEVN